MDVSQELNTRLVMYTIFFLVATRGTAFKNTMWPKKHFSTYWNPKKINASNTTDRTPATWNTVYHKSVCFSVQVVHVLSFRKKKKRLDLFWCITWVRETWWKVALPLHALWASYCGRNPVGKTFLSCARWMSNSIEMVGETLNRGLITVVWKHKGSKTSAIRVRVLEGHKLYIYSTAGA